MEIHQPRRSRVAPDRPAAPSVRYALQLGAGLLLAAFPQGCQDGGMPMTAPGATTHFTLAVLKAGQPVAAAGSPAPAAASAPPTGTPTSPSSAPGPASPHGGGNAGSGGNTGSGGPAAPVGSPEPVPTVAPVDAGQVDGQVVKAAPGGADGPAIAAAAVHTYGGSGLQAVSDDQGRFQLATQANLESIVVSAPGFATSQVVGLGAGALTLHLAATRFPLLLAPVQIPVEGDVYTPDGQPAAGAIVQGGDAGGAHFGPFTTDDSGHFAGKAYSDSTPVLQDQAVWAFMPGDRGQPVQLGLASHVDVEAGSHPITVFLTDPTGSVAVAPSGPAGARTVSVRARAANGFEIMLRAWPNSATDLTSSFFTVPDGEVWGYAQYLAADGLARSSWRSPFAAPGTQAPHLLDYPVAPVQAIASDGPLSWPAVTGASVYRVALQNAGSTVPLWEAVCPSTGLVAREVPDGGDSLVLQALGGADADLRSLASLDGPRQLRLADPDTDHATYWSSRTTRITR